MKEQFPIVLVPPGIRRIKSELPPVPPFLETLPKLPKANVRPVNVPLLVAAFVILLIFSVSVLQSNVMLGLTLLTLGIVIIGFQAWIQGQSYPRRLKSNAVNLEHYYEALENYSRREAEYQQATAAARTQEKIQAYQYPKLLQVLTRSTAEDGHQDVYTLNEIEDCLFSRLNFYFPDKIVPRSFFNLGDIAPYVMDFAYIDDAINLRIDIEVDEPWSSDGVPQHYLRNSNDQAWNDFFLRKGWSVIRFSANQIQHHPDSCCKAIAQLAYEIVQDEAILKPFDAVVDLEPETGWTEAEARQQAAEVVPNR